MLRVLKELKGKTSFRPIAEESDRPDNAPEKKVSVGAAITRNLHNSHLIEPRWSTVYVNFLPRLLRFIFFT